MIIVIPMAGKSQRFRDAGYQQPKFMLPLNKATVLDHVLEGLRRYLNSATFLFITRDAEAEAFARSRAWLMGVKNVLTHVIPDPKNMNDTIYRSFTERPDINRSQPIVIHVVDTFRPGFHAPHYSDNEGMIEFCLNDNVRNNLPLISHMEPVFGSSRILKPGLSLLTLRSTGVYYFRSLHHLMQGYEKAQDALETSKILRFLRKAGMPDDTLQALALVPAMRSLGHNVGPYMINRYDVIFCGVPREYETLLKVWPMRPPIYGSSIPKLGNDRR